jgi:hypothetical protein
MASLRIVAFALALLGASMVVGEASAAMPVNGLVSAKQQITDNIQDVRCYRCGWGWGSGPYWGGRYWGYRRAWGPGPYAVGPGPYWGRPYWGWRRWAWRGCGWRRCWW